MVLQVIIGCGPAQQGLGSAAAETLLDAVHVPYAPDKVVILIDLVGG